MANNTNGFRPINFSFNSNNGNNGNGGNGGKRSPIGTIIILILICFYVYSVYSEPEYFEEYNENNVDYSSSNSYQNNGSNSQSLVDLLFGDSNYSSNSNQDYTSYEDTSIKNVSDQKYTLMIYMCGSNLESSGGYASSDIEEMLKSTIADEVNVLIYTGGAKRWFDYGISSRTNQIYTIKNHKLELVKDNIGLKNMASPDTLVEFMSFAKNNYPSDKYSLVFWDHGGGAVSGFASDELAGKGDTLTIDEIKKAVDSFGTKLEFVGFDACLMANVETAYALKNGAKYLVASEETEPGTGWNYIKILNELSKDSSQIGSVTGRTIVDSFIQSNSSYRNPDATLSVTDLSKMDNVYKNLVEFMKDVDVNTFNKNKYNYFSQNIQMAKDFGDGGIDTVDLIDFATKMNISSSNNLISSVKEAVTYNKTNRYVENAYGLSIYIPYKKLSYYNKMQSIYKNIGMGSDYTNTLTKFVNVLAGGKNRTYSVNKKTYNQDTTDYSSYSWFDSLFINQLASYYEETSLKDEILNVEDKGDYFSLHLTDKDWEKITKVESVVWYDDENGYIDMGVDSYFQRDSKGDLKVEFDGTWIAINGDNVRYEVLERTNNYEKGKVPAVVNGERVNIILYFDKEVPDGVVLGYIPDYEQSNQSLFEKGIWKFEKGDKIDFVANYYTYDGTFKDEYYINDTLIYGDSDLKVSYESLGDGECLIYYRLTDVYNNVYYTEPVIFE